MGPSRNRSPATTTVESLAGLAQSASRYWFATTLYAFGNSSRASDFSGEGGGRDGGGAGAKNCRGNMCGASVKELAQRRPQMTPDTFAVRSFQERVR